MVARLGPSRPGSARRQAAVSRPTEFWLWWITDEFGERRMTTYRMSRQVALERYPDAQAVPGTLEIRNLPDSDDEQHSLGSD